MPDSRVEKTQDKTINNNAKKSPDVDGGWAWVVACAAVLQSAISSGLYYTFSLYYVMLLNEFQSSRALTAWVGSLNNGVFMLAGPVATYFISCIGTRYTIMLGGLFTLLGYALSSLTPNLTILFVTYGTIAAFGCCLNYTGWIIALSTYFDKKYEIVFSVTQTGVGVGIFLFGPLLKYLIHEFGWRGSFLLCGACGLHFTLLGSLVFPPRKSTKQVVIDEEHNLLQSQTEEEPVVQPTLSISDILKDCSAWLLHLNSFFWLLATLIIFILMGEYSSSKSLDDYYIYMFSAMGVGDLVGRIFTGPVVEYCKVNPIILYTLSQLFCSVVIMAFLYVSSGVHLIVQGVLFSFTYGMQCVLLAIVPRFIFGSNSLANVFGVNMFFSGAGILIGPPIAGLLVDMTHSYDAAFIFAAIGELISAFVCFALIYSARRRQNSMGSFQRVDG